MKSKVKVCLWRRPANVKKKLNELLNALSEDDDDLSSITEKSELTENTGRWSHEEQEVVKHIEVEEQGQGVSVEEVSERKKKLNELLNALSEDDDDLSSITEESEPTENTGRWSHEEHQRFLQGLDMYGKKWSKIADVVRTRTRVQVTSHAQTYFQKKTEGRLELTKNLHALFLKNLNKNTHASLRRKNKIKKLKRKAKLCLWKWKMNVKQSSMSG